MNDSSSEVDGDDFRAKTVGTREAEVCINIQIKKVIGFDELACLHHCTNFIFRNRRHIPCITRPLDYSDKISKRLKRHLNSFSVMDLSERYSIVVMVRLVLYQHQITQWVEHLTRKSLPGSNFWFGPSLFLLYCYIWRHANS